VGCASCLAFLADQEAIKVCNCRIFCLFSVHVDGLRSKGASIWVWCVVLRLYCCGIDVASNHTRPNSGNDKHHLGHYFVTYI